jgi:betaine reductase
MSGMEATEVNENTRVVHYINQFFGGIGGEDRAHIEPQLRIGPVGPGMVLQEALKGWGDIVATVICGDNYFAERMEEAVQEIIRLISPYDPGLIIAGPAFNAGRYGVASGEICKSVQEKLQIPAVTAMYEENPGVELYKKTIYIVKTSDSVKGIRNAISLMAEATSKPRCHMRQLRSAPLPCF